MYGLRFETAAEEAQIYIYRNSQGICFGLQCAADSSASLAVVAVAAVPDLISISINSLHLHLAAALPTNLLCVLRRTGRRALSVVSG
ncbi:hypothetical protein ACLOJK_033639 [Asimina triloba]